MGGFQRQGPICQAQDWFDPIDSGTLALSTLRPPGQRAETTFRSSPHVVPVTAHVLVTAASAEDTKKSDTKKTDDKKSDPGSAAPGTAAGTSETQKAEEPAGSNQGSTTFGIAYTRHKYLTRHGPGDPLNEVLFQAVAAYTRQFHKNNAAGLELQIPAQFQYSFMTNTPSIGLGPQLSYVKPFGHNKWQVSGFVQTLGAVAISAPSPSSWQFQPSAGVNLTYQPKEWIQISGQGAAGFTVQTHGPTSFDYGFVLSLGVVF